MQFCLNELERQKLVRHHARRLRQLGAEPEKFAGVVERMLSPVASEAAEPSLAELNADAGTDVARPKPDWRKNPRPGELSNRKNRRSRSPFPAAAAKSAGASRDSGRGRPRISIRMHGSRPGGDIQPTPPKTETPRPNGVRERKAMPNPRREPAPGETFSRQRAEHDPAVGGMRWSTCLDRCPVDEPRHQGAREPREYALVTAQLATSAARSQPNSRLPATAHACLSRSLPIGPGVRSSQELAPETGRTRPGEF
jgi:hypothetical protein